MSNVYDTEKAGVNARHLFGRKKLFTGFAEVHAGNVHQVLDEVKSLYEKNRNEICYLFDYAAGKQPVLSRKKKVRDEICSRVVENRASEIVAFKTGYLCGDPISLIAKEADDSLNEQVNRLNDWMESLDKFALDQELIETQQICGTAYRLVLPAMDPDADSPFELYNVDPRGCFVVYGTGIEHEPLLGVIVSKHKTEAGKEEKRYSCYTRNELIVLDDSMNLVSVSPHVLGCVPVFEYPSNNFRMGAFEPVLPLLDALNDLLSNRLDGVAQEIQSFLKFVDCDIDEEKFKALKEMGAILVKSANGLKPDVDLIESHLDQNHTQILKDDLQRSIQEICGLPNRNGGKSTSDTGAAVVLRDGWSLAESRAKDAEAVFKRAERKALKLILNICSRSGLALKVKDIDIKFTRRNYENIASKSQVLIAMLENDKIHPLQAYQHSGMFSDPESAYKMGMDYFNEQKKQVREDLPKNAEVSEKTEKRAETVREDGKTQRN